MAKVTTKPRVKEEKLYVEASQDGRSPKLEDDTDLDALLQLDCSLQEEDLLVDEQPDATLRQCIPASDARLLNSPSKRKLANGDDSSHSGYNSDRTGCGRDTGDLGYDDHANANDTLAGQAKSPKRVRSNDWPFRRKEPSTTEKLVTRKDSEPRLRSKKGQSVSRAHYNSPPSGRRSRFIEGSMRDRASEQPPSAYLGEDYDDASPLDQHARGDELIVNGEQKTLVTRLPHHLAANKPITPSASSTNLNIPGARHSGLFRFGKALASAFNPFGVWDNVSEIWKAPQDEPKDSKDIMTERKIQAAKAYAELKAAGYKGTKKVSLNHVNGGSIGRQDQMIERVTVDVAPPAPFCPPDSATPSSSRKDLCPTPSRPEFGSAIKSSFQELRKARSYVGMASTKRRSMSPVPTPVASGRDLIDTARTLNKQPSRKDLAKQQRLLKKVSNLEDKLQRARRELREITGQDEEILTPQASIEGSDFRRFVPGTLPSLPSERILLGQLGDTSDVGTTPGSKAAAGYRIAKDVSTPGYGRTLRRSKITIANDPPSRKRRSLLTSHLDYRQDQNEISDLKASQHGSGDNRRDEGGNTPEFPHAPKRQQPPRKAKLQKTGKETHEPGAADGNPSSGTRHRYSTRRRSSLGLRDDGTNFAAVTVKPGQNGHEVIPPVPPLPRMLASSNETGADKFEWPEGIF